MALRVTLGVLAANLAATEEPPKYPALKKLREALRVIYLTTKDSDHNPAQVDDVLTGDPAKDFYTAWATYSVLRDGVDKGAGALRALAAVDSVLDVVDGIIGKLPGSLRDKAYFGYTQAKSKVDNLIIEHASKLATAIQASVLVFGAPPPPPASTGSRMFSAKTTLKPSAALVPQGFPANAVAVRIGGGFRIVVVR